MTAVRLWLGGGLRRATDLSAAAQAVAMRVLGVAALVAIVAWVARSDSAVGAGVAPLVAALAVLSAAWLAFLLLPGLDRRLQLAALVVVGICAATLNHDRPDSPAFLAALLAMAGAAARLPVGWALTALAAITAAMTLSKGVGATHTIPAGVTYTVAAALLFGVATYVRTLRQANRRAERIVVELQATRRAEAEAAVLGERARLAREMHDILAHVLSALSIQLETAALLLARDGGSAEALEFVERARRLTRDGLDEAKGAIGALRGDGLPGPELLGDLVEDFRRATGVPTTLELDGPPPPLGHEAGLAVYRTAQEALTNIRKHAKHAAAVTVSLRRGPDAVTLTVEDRLTNGFGNGRSPPPADGAGPRRGGYGLIGMRERAELLGGDLRAGETPAGFRVRLRLPV